MAGFGLVFDGAFMVRHDHRHTHWAAVFQVRFFSAGPLRKRSTLRRRRALANSKYHLATDQRHPFGSVRRHKRLDTVLYYYRHTFRPAMLQNSETCPYALRREDHLKEVFFT